MSDTSENPPVAGGGLWTHFPDRVAYRFSEVRRLEPT
jgi:hypothetical protein